MEEWRYIKDFEGLYKISTDGRVFSIRRNIFIKPGTCCVYLMVSLIDQYSLDGKFIKTFRSMSEAARTTNAPRTDICRVCSNEYKTSGGYIWKKHNQRKDK